MYSDVINLLKESIWSALSYLIICPGVGFILNIAILHFLEALGLLPFSVKQMPIKRKVKCWLYASVAAFGFATLFRQFSC